MQSLHNAVSHRLVYQLLSQWHKGSTGAEQLLAETLALPVPSSTRPAPCDGPTAASADSNCSSSGAEKVPQDLLQMNTAAAEAAVAAADWPKGPPLGSNRYRQSVQRAITRGRNASDPGQVQSSSLWQTGSCDLGACSTSASSAADCLEGVGGGSAVLLQVPADLSRGCRTYGELFQQLLFHQGMLGLGLYRQAEHCGATLPYVHTNPAKVGNASARTLGNPFVQSFSA